MHDDQNLSPNDLITLINRVFHPRPEDSSLAILVDLPRSRTEDTDLWRARREIAAQWAGYTVNIKEQLGLRVELFIYRRAEANNAELPLAAWPWSEGVIPGTDEGLDPAAQASFSNIFAGHQLFMALTQLSATAPLKLAAKTHGFRAATMPGFTRSMIPALRLDYNEIHRRVTLLTALLDRSSGVELRFTVKGGPECQLTLDLRHRGAHASSGLLPEPGTAGNLPSGEAYIVPYEGEVPGDPSRSAGRLPVQFGEEVVIYKIENNRAVAVESTGPTSEEEATHLRRDPAYGNLAELGLGVLSDFGLAPLGEILLDEKLGLHIAFGRSDHFGGQVGVAQFIRPDTVIHIDRVYISALQPKVQVACVDLISPDGDAVALIRDDEYVLEGLLES